jgi:ubiquinone/menaquinone biosynthesis C-methylase UbiE
VSASNPFQIGGLEALRSPRAYERYLVPALFRGWGESLVRLARPRNGERILDVACGTGIVARLAAPRAGAAGEVTGLDLDPAMIKVAREASSSVGPVIRWQQGDAHELPFPSESFDVVFCQQGLPFFASGPAALTEMRRVLADGGRLAVSVWRGVQQGVWATALAVTFERFGDQQLLGALCEPCPLSEPESLQTLLEHIGFRDCQIEVSVEYLHSRSAEELLYQAVALTTLAGPLSELSSNAWRALVAALEESLGPYRRVGGFAVPIEANTALARR